jgi:hypothetical protein
MASKVVEDFSLHELKAFNLELLDGNDDHELAALAERDNWDYTLDSVIQHRPPGLRRRRPKNCYEFLVLYKYLERSDEPGQENPSWQPYENIAHTEALREYCSQPKVVAELGNNFFVAEEVQ